MVPTQASIPQALSCLPRLAPLTWPSFCLMSGSVTPRPTPERAACLLSRVRFKTSLKKGKIHRRSLQSGCFGSFISQAASPAPALMLFPGCTEVFGIILARLRHSSSHSSSSVCISILTNVKGIHHLMCCNRIQLNVNIFPWQKTSL